MKSSDPITRLSEIRAQIVVLRHEAHAIIDSLKAGFEGAPEEAAAVPIPKRRGRKPKAPSLLNTSGIGRKPGRRGRKPAMPLGDPVPALAPSTSPAVATPVIQSDPLPAPASVS